MDSRQDNEDEDTESKEEKSSEKSLSSEEVLRSNVPTKSESMPLLKSTSSSKEDAMVVTSESSLARRRKMKMIVARIDPLLSSESSQTLARSSGYSTGELKKENYQAKKLESRTALPVLQDAECDPSNRLKEVTFNELPEDKDYSSQRSQSSERRRTKPLQLATRDASSQHQLQENGDLIDIAENPHPSIKSFYFPPNPDRGVASSASLRTRIISELCPLLHQMNEIKGKLRVLSLMDPSLLNQRHHSTQCASPFNASGYYLHRTETFGRHAPMHLGSRQAFDGSSQEIAPVVSFQPIDNQTSASNDFYSARDTIGQSSDTHDANASGNLSRRVGRILSSGMSNCAAGEDDSQVTLNNFHFKFRQLVEKDPSGSLIPSVSSTCYRCHRNRARNYDDAAGCSTCNKDGYAALTSGTSIARNFSNTAYQPMNLVEKATMVSAESGCNLLEEPTKESWTPLRGSQVQVISVNTELYTDAKSFNENLAKNSDHSLRCLQNQSVSASLIGKTRYLNSQTSLIISKKDQDIITPEPEKQKNRSSTRLVSKHEHTKDQKKKKKAVKDLDVQCSGLNLKEIVLGQSMESLLRPSGSDESNKSKSIQVTDEKVVVVPIIFTDGVPEPPKFSMFAVRSRTRVPRVECHLLKVKKNASSMSQNSLESCERSSNRNASRMSVSCVSRSSLRCRNESRFSSGVKLLSDHRYKSDDKHRKVGSMTSGHSDSTRAHSETSKKALKKVMYGMRSSPEDFAFDT